MTYATTLSLYPAVAALVKPVSQVKKKERKIVTENVRKGERNKEIQKESQ